jgi:L-ascorbate peroxidase
VADAPILQESELREYLAALMPIEHAPAHLRLAFHDAGTFDRHTLSGGADGSVHLPDELQRAGNTGWGHACVQLLAEAKAAFPDVSWADLIAVGAAAAVQKCGGPVMQVGLGRRDGTEPASPNRLPGGFESAGLLKSIFARMGLGPRDLVVLSGAHTLGHTQRRPFTLDTFVFSNSYFVDLLRAAQRSNLPTDETLLSDPELRAYVEQYASDQVLFWSDFTEAFRRLTWLGNVSETTSGLGMGTPGAPVEDPQAVADAT